MAKKVYCDKCGKDATGEEVEMALYADEYELCRKCYLEIKSLVHKEK